MYNNNIKQNRSGLWIIRPQGGGGTRLLYYVLPVSISSTGPHISRHNPYPNPLPAVDDCFTLDPITFPEEKSLNVDLTKNTVSCFFDDINASANLAANFTGLTWNCSVTYSLANVSSTMYFDCYDQCGKAIASSSSIPIAGAQFDCEIGGGGTPRTVLNVNNFYLPAELPGPRYLSAIIPKVRWLGGGGTFSLTGNLVFQYIETV